MSWGAETPGEKRAKEKLKRARQQKRLEKGKDPDSGCGFAILHPVLAGTGLLLWLHCRARQEGSRSS